jgi:uncharacterized membrane protein YfcA
MLLILVVLAVLIGITLGLMGGGGSILTVPVLTVIAGLPTRDAIATSLFVVGVTSIAAVVTHARAGRVCWRTGLGFGAAAMIGGFAGGRLSGLLPAPMLLIGFAAMMLATAIAMLRGRRAMPSGEVAGELPWARVLVHGAVVGAVAGTVGAGGGFLVVPALVLLGGLPMRPAIGTSLLVIAMQSFAALAGHLGHATIDWRLASTIALAAVAGSLIGGRYAGRVAPETLRRGFGWFVLAMAGFLLIAKAPASIKASPAYQAAIIQGWPLTLAVAGLLVAVVIRRDLRRAIAA